MEKLRVEPVASMETLLMERGRVRRESMVPGVLCLGSAWALLFGGKLIIEVFTFRHKPVFSSG
jgi:hypothetical protein